METKIQFILAVTKYTTQVDDNPTMKESVSTSSNQGGLNLAAELASSIPDWNNQKESESDKTIQRKYLTLYAV